MWKPFKFIQCMCTEILKQKNRNPQQKYDSKPQKTPKKHILQSIASAFIFILFCDVALGASAKKCLWRNSGRLVIDDGAAQPPVSLGF